MRTIILGNQSKAQKVFNILTCNNDDVVRTCKLKNYTYAEFKNGDAIQCLTPSESIRGNCCDILYVPSTMTIEDVDWWGMVLSHGRDIEVIVYRVNKIKNTNKQSIDSQRLDFEKC